MQCTHTHKHTLRLPIKLYMLVFHPRARRPEPTRDDTRDQGLVIVAHLGSLLLVGTLVVGLTVGSIVMARRCIDTEAASGLAAPATDDGGGLRADMTGTTVRASR